MTQTVHAVERDEDFKVRLRAEIEASIPTEEVKLRDGPFDGVTAKIASGESCLIVTQSSFSTCSPHPPPVVYEYQRDPKPQFRFTKREDYDPAREPVTSTLVDDSDFREGLYRGLWRAASLLIIKEQRLRGDKDWRAGNAISDVIDELRKVADALGFGRSDLYSLYPGDEKEYDRK